MKRKNLLLLALGCLCLTARAQTYLSPEAYRDKVEAYSRVLKQQRLKYEASAETRKIAATGFLPQVDISAEGTANLNHLDQWNSPKGEYRPYTYKALATLTQPLYTGGSLIAARDMARADEELARLSTETTIDQLRYQSEAVYWNAAAACAYLEAAALFRNIIRQQYDLVQERFSNGAIGRTDLLMISTRQKEAELQYAKARQNLQLARQQLNILMGTSPDTPIDSLSGIDSPAEQIVPLNLDEVLMNRADYASAAVSVGRSEAERRVALSKYRPQVSFFFASGWDTGISYMGQDVPHTPLAGINVSIPILRWGARFKTARQQKAYLGIRRLQQSYLADAILEELSAADVKLTETALQVKTARENMQLADESLSLITFSYNEGRAAMADVLSAQLSWIQARSNLISAHLAQKMAVAEYRKVVSE